MNAVYLISTFEKSIGSGRRTITPSCLKILHSSFISTTAFFKCLCGKDLPPFLLKNDQYFSFVLAFTSRENLGTVAPNDRICGKCL